MMIMKKRERERERWRTGVCGKSRYTHVRTHTYVQETFLELIILNFNIIFLTLSNKHKGYCQLNYYFIITLHITFALSSYSLDFFLILEVSLFVETNFPCLIMFNYVENVPGKQRCILLMCFFHL